MKDPQFVRSIPFLAAAICAFLPACGRNTSPNQAVPAAIGTGIPLPTPIGVYTPGQGPTPTPVPGATAVPGSLSAAPAALSFNAVGGTLAFIPSEAGYKGMFTANASSCSGIATLALTSAAGLAPVFNVVSAGPGQCVIDVRDSNQQNALVSVSVNSPVEHALAATPASMAFQRGGDSQTFYASEPSYLGALTVNAAGCQNIASVSTLTGSGPLTAFTVTAQSAGQCGLILSDAQGQETPITVSVTTMSAFLYGLPPTTQSVGITVNGGNTQYVQLRDDDDVSPAGEEGGNMTIAAPVGVDLFAFVIYDEAYGLGNILAKANVTSDVELGRNNQVFVEPNPFVGSILLSLSNAAPAAGAATNVSVNVTVLDADGNPIQDDAGFNNPIELSISDPSGSGTLSLNTTSMQYPWEQPNLYYNGGTLSQATIVASAAGIPTVSAVFSPTATVYEFGVNGAPAWITSGPDGNMWFTEPSLNNVAQINPNGSEADFAVPTASSGVAGITAGADGNLWFTESAASNIGTLSLAGTFNETATLFSNDQPELLADRGDGSMWYVGEAGDHIGYMDENDKGAGETTITTANSQPVGLAFGPDNNVYFTESGADKIGRIDNLFGTISELALTAGSDPQQIIRGPDGNLWFTEMGTSNIAMLSPQFFILRGEFPTLTANAAPMGLTIGADGALWFTEAGLDRIGRITTAGVVTEYPMPSTGDGLQGIALAPDGSLWFAESSRNVVAKLVY